MDDSPVIAGLLAKRSELQTKITDLTHELAQRKRELVLVEETQHLFAPTITHAKVQVARSRRARHFAPGEITKRCYEAMRLAPDGYVTVDGIAWKAMQDKKLDLADAPMRDDFTRRFTWALNLLSRGAVRRIGHGAEAKWTRR
jgi:hypothetical protein